VTERQHIHQRRFVRASLFGGALILIAFGLFFVWLHPPTDDSYYPKCTLHKYTGLHCPGCGLTRSVFSLLHGEVLQALAYNLLWPIVLPIMVWGIGTSLWNQFFPRYEVNFRLPSALLAVWPWVLMITLLAFGILRNIPAYPFDLLAPHELK